MSSRNHGVNDFGYIFTPEMLEKLIAERNPPDIEPDDVWAMAEYMNLEIISEFSGEALPLDENGYDTYYDDYMIYCGDPVFYIPVYATTNLFHAAYASKEELANDLKKRYPNWLPNDPNEIYKGVYHIMGTYYG